MQILSKLSNKLVLMLNQAKFITLNINTKSINTLPTMHLYISRVGVGKPKRYPVVFIFQHDNFLVTDFLQIKTD